MTQESPYSHGQSEPGPLADEAAKLIGAAQDWWHRNADGKLATGSPECCWCPVCQLIATMRGDRPEITERLAETQTAVAGLLRALADAVVPATPPTATRTPGPRVHRIELDDDTTGTS